MTMILGEDGVAFVEAGAPHTMSGTFLTTGSGLRFRVRSARPEDDGTIEDFFGHVSRTDLRFRFLTGLNKVSLTQVAMLTHPGHRQTESFIAFTADGSMMIASAMLARDHDLARGEVAIAIREDHKYRGIGWSLLSYIAREAESKGEDTRIDRKPEQSPGDLSGARQGFRGSRMSG